MNRRNPPSPFALPEHWTGEQALAAFELLDAIREQLCNQYGPQVQQLCHCEVFDVSASKTAATQGRW